MEGRVSIVPVPEAEDLKAIQQEQFEEAHTNLITGKTPKDVVFQRPARGGLKVDYVPGWWFIQQMNALFGYRWNWSILEHGILESDSQTHKKQVWVKGRLTITAPDGQLVVQKDAFGGSDVKTYKERPTEMFDFADDLKSASTDALKKAASLIGFARDIYGNREVQEETGPTAQQLNALYMRGEKAGMDKVKVDSWVKEKYGDVPQKLESQFVVAAISELIKIGQK